MRHRVPALPAARGEVVTWIALLVLAALGWAVTIVEARSMGHMADMRQMADMSGMPGMPGMPGASPSGFLFLSVWTAMMVAMMFPSVAPAAAAVTALGESPRQAGRPAGPAWSFLIGYLAIWSLVGVGVYLLSVIVPDVGMAGPGFRASRPAIGALILIMAGVYQLSPVKRLFLGQCRTPLDSLRQEWGTGAIGSLRVGITHGALCVGCCGGLMLVLLAVGLMNLGWMALLAAVIFLEKVAPYGPRVGKFAGVALLASGIVMLIA